MSGGTYDYLGSRMRRMAYDDRLLEGSHLRQLFAHHLMEAAAGVDAIEMVDSGNWSPGKEDAVLEASLYRQPQDTDISALIRKKDRLIEVMEEINQQLKQAIKEGNDR